MSSSCLLPRTAGALLGFSLALAACDSGHDGGPDPADGADRPKNALVAIDETAIRARVEGQELRLTVPIDRVSNDVVDTQLQLELFPVVGGNVLASGPLLVHLEQKSGQFQASLHLPQGIASQADLGAYNVRIHDSKAGGLSITRSAFAMVPRYEVRLEGPARLSAAKDVSYRVRAHDPKTFAPVPNASVSLVLSRGADEVRRFEANTDQRGDAFFVLSLAEAGDYAVSAAAQSSGTQANVQEALTVESGSSRLLLTTDKPIYQPGQTVHLRALALRKGSNEPVGQAPVRFEIHDGKGNKIFKREMVSDAYGIASADFRLGSVLNLGTFQVHVVAGELDVQKTFEVSRYVLPKFAIDVDLAKPWYRAGEQVSGSIDARYFFGKVVNAGDVEIVASSVDVGSNAFARVVGKTSADGTFPFTLTLPNTLAGLPLEQGKALVSLHVKVTDAAGQLVEKDAAVVVAAQDAILVVVPEGTVLIPGVSNRLQVFLSDPGGAPVADVEVEIKQGTQLLTLRTDAFGQATGELVPDAAAEQVIAKATLPSGAVVNQFFNFSLQTGTEHVAVRSDRAVYDVGDSAAIEIATNDQNNVYVDWLHEGQAVDQRTLEVVDGKARFDFPLDTGLAGNNRVEAYVVDQGGNVVRAGSTIFVREGGALKVELSTNKTQYGPGESAELTFSIKDEQGAPRVAALGVQIVDEAVFELVDAKPGLLRTYFELDDSFAEPHYQIGAPPGSIASLLFDDTQAADAAQQDAAQRRAKATFAALGDMGVTGIHAGSWKATLSSLKQLLAPAYDQETTRLKEAAESVIALGERYLKRQGCDKEEYYCDAKNQPYADLLLAYVRAHFQAYDPWGQAYFNDANASGLVLVSAGPDEVHGTDDDNSLIVASSSITLAKGEDAGIAFEDGEWDNDLSAPAAGGDESAHGDGDGDGNGSSEPRVRREFPETLYVNPAIITGADGTATIQVPLADSITEWRVSSLANAVDGRLGGSTHGITVFQDFFVDIGFPAELTRGDEVTFPIALYNYLDEPQSVTVTLEAGDWYTPLAGTSATVEIAANAVRGVSFPVRVDDVGTHKLTARALGKARSDAVERAVRVVSDGKAFPSAQSGSLGAGSQALSVTYPANAVPGSGELSLSVFPGFLSSVVSGMDSMLREPSGCFEQTTSTTWPNVLVLRYMRDTKQVTPEIELKAESYISAGYQRLLTYEHPAGGFSWFGTQDPMPYLSVTAFGVMEFADMAKAYEVDATMLARTIDWLTAQQQSDGTWKGDQTEFFSFNTSTIRNTAFTVWALASAGHTGADVDLALTYLGAHWDDEAKDGYTLAMVANAFAVARPSDAVLEDVLGALDELKKVDGDKISWDSGETQTTFYGAGNDAGVTTTALVAHALLSAGGHPDLVKGAIASLLASRDSMGNFGSTQATIWSLRTLLLAASKGTEGAVGTFSVAVDGAPFTQFALTADQADVLTTVDLASLATLGAHEVQLSFAGTGKPSYNLVSNYHLPWSQVPAEPVAPLAVAVSYDRTDLAVNDTVQAKVTITNQSDATANMILVDVGIPPGFEVQTDDLDAYLSNNKLSKYEITPRQLILYVTKLDTDEVRAFSYRLRATMPVKASDGGAKVYPYYEPARKSHAAAITLSAHD